MAKNSKLVGLASKIIYLPKDYLSLYRNENIPKVGDRIVIEEKQAAHFKWDDCYYVYLINQDRTVWMPRICFASPAESKHPLTEIFL